MTAKTEADKTDKELLREAQRVLKITRADLARLLLVHPKTASRWERDSDLPSARVMDPLRRKVLEWMLEGTRPADWPKF